MTLTTRILATVCTAALGTAAAAGDFAQSAYTTPLADVCPNPLIIQKDWLMQIEHGPILQLIGAGGTMESGVYKGPLGSTGIDLEILEGGSGIGLGDGETSYSALFTGNSKAGVRPHLAYHELDNAFIFSKRFPTTGVFVPLDIAPTALLWDPATYPDGVATLDDLIALAQTGDTMAYVSTTKRTFGKFLVDSGVPQDFFVEGYRGDLENFVVNNGKWLNQGFLTAEVHQLENGRNWEKPIDYVTVDALGYENYTGMISVATPRMDELAPCLEKLVPIMQQATVDFANDPSEVSEVVVGFNDAGFGTSWWKSPADLVDYASAAMIEAGIIGNGVNDTIGDFDMDKVAVMETIVTPNLDERAIEGVTGADVVTNRFIDPAIGLD